MSRFYFVNNKIGQTLVGTLVAAGVAAVVMGLIINALIQQNVSQKFLSQKLEMNDLTANLLATFLKANNCSCQFKNDVNVNPNFENYSRLAFDSTQPPRSQKIPVGTLYSGCKSGAFVPPILAKDGELIPGSSFGLLVDKVELAELEQVGALPDEWQGQWRISFQTGRNALIRSVKPIRVTQKVKLDLTVPEAARILGCTGISTGTGTPGFLAKWSLVPGILDTSGIFEDSVSGRVGIKTNDMIPTKLLGIGGNFAETIGMERGVFGTGSGKNFTISGGGAEAGFLDGDGGNLILASGIATGTGSSSIHFQTASSGVSGGGDRVPSTKMTLLGNGNVGIGTVTPGTGSKLTVAGQISAKSYSGAAGAINWANGNAQSTSFDCSTPLTFENLRDGGSYTLAVTSNNTLRCDFATAVTGDDSATVGYRFQPANGVRPVNTHTIYSFQRINDQVYVSWMVGF